MKTVFEKAQALGEALRDSEAFQAMSAAEEAVLHDAAAAALIGRFQVEKAQMEQLLSQADPDAAAIARHNEAMRALQSQIAQVETIATANRARSAFQTLMNQVNQVLKFIVTGDTGEGGCGGNCGACGGGCGD